MNISHKGGDASLFVIYSVLPPSGVKTGGRFFYAEFMPKLSEFYNSFFEYLRQEGKAKQTLKHYRRMLFGALSHSVQDIELDQLVRTDASKVCEAGRTHGATGEEHALIAFRMLLRFIQDSGYAVPIDWRNIQVKKSKRPDVQYLTQEEIEKVRSAIDSLGEGIALRTRVFFELLIHTGLRTGEAVNIKKEEIAWQDDGAALISMINSKTKEQEKVLACPRVVLWMKKYLEKRSDDSPYLFVSDRGKQVAASTIRWAFGEAEKKAKLQKKIDHRILRKTFVTILIDRGADLKTVQHLARHKCEYMTLHYYAAVRKEKARSVLVDIMEKI